jgi:hypothetical protein
MTEADLLRCIEAVDRRKQQGERSDIASCEAKLPQGKSAQKTAEIVGTSRAKVERARTVLSDPKEKEAVLSGKKSINKASEDAHAEKKDLTKSPHPWHNGHG